MLALTKYTFLESEVLGSGADGSIVSAKSHHGHSVAVKLFSLETEVRRSVFQSEVFFSRTLSKEVGLPVHDVVADQTTGAIVYDRATGDLLDLLEATYEGHFPTSRATLLFLELCSLVERMHDQRVAHLDIKPENVLIDGKGRLRLCDFGRAHRWSQGSSRLYDGLFSSIATKEYSSPERFEREDFDVAAADIFSLGVTFHVLLTGSFPWGSSKRAPYPRKLSFARKIDHNCLRLLQWMLQKDPLARPSIKQVLTYKWGTSKVPLCYSLLLEGQAGGKGEVNSLAGRGWQKIASIPSKDQTNRSSVDGTEETRLLIHPEHDKAHRHGKEAHLSMARERDQASLL